MNTNVLFMMQTTHWFFLLLRGILSDPHLHTFAGKTIDTAQFENLSLHPRIGNNVCWRNASLSQTNLTATTRWQQSDNRTDNCRYLVSASPLWWIIDQTQYPWYQNGSKTCIWWFTFYPSRASITDVFVRTATCNKRAG